MKDMISLSVWPIFFALFSIFNQSVGLTSQTDPNEVFCKYAVVVDAGSTGSRLFIYKFSENENGETSLVGVSGGKVRPGLSSFGDNPSSMSDYFEALLINAVSLVPDQYRNETSLYIKGTAGMRLLEHHKQERLWDTLFTDLNGRLRHLTPFKYERKNFGSISGHLEAFYAVISSNYIAGRIDAHLRTVAGRNVIGAMDMGGSSNQLILHKADENVEGKKVTHEDFWSHSWLNFGAEKVQQKVIRNLFDNHTSSDNTDSKSSSFRNPCAFVGFQSNYSESVEIFGTGDGAKCLEVIRQTIWADMDESSCAAATIREADSASRACGVDGVALPEVAGHDFFAMSVYFYAFDCIRHLNPDHAGFIAWPKSSLSELEAAVLDFCALEWSEVKSRFDGNTHPYTLSHQLSDRCLEGLYMVLLLEKGFGFNKSDRRITYALEVDGHEVEWTLGFALAEIGFTPDEKIVREEL